jgi:hypothetical protein
MKFESVNEQVNLLKAVHNIQQITGQHRTQLTESPINIKPLKLEVHEKNSVLTPHKTYYIHYKDQSLKAFLGKKTTA